MFTNNPTHQSRDPMINQDNNPDSLTPEASLSAIHNTMSQAQSSMYLAGTATILLVWGAIMALGYLAEYTINALAADFADSNPWYHAPLWGGLVIIGMVASSIIGSRATKNFADAATARKAGLKVFTFWISVAAAAWLIPALSGLWANGATAEHTAGVAIGIVSLGYVLFGLMSRPAISILGIGIAAAFYIPYHFAGDAAYAITALLMLTLIVVAAIWLRKSGIQ